MGSTTTLSGSWQSPSVRHLISQNSVLATACLLYLNLPRYSSGMQAGTTPGLNSTLEARARIAISLANVLLFHNGCCTTFAIPMSLRGGVSLRARGELRCVPLSYFLLFTCVLLTSYFLLLTCVLLPPHRCSDRSPQLGSCLHSPALSPESDLFICFQGILKIGRLFFYCDITCCKVQLREVLQLFM